MDEAESVTDPETRREALELLHAWAANHPDEHIDDALVRDVVRVSPYRIQLRTRFEARSLRFDVLPAQSTERPTEHLPDPWAVELPTDLERSREGTSLVGSFPLVGVTVVQVCLPCAGSGMHTCHRCRGTGNDPNGRCTACQGTGQASCTTCMSSGRVSGGVRVISRIDHVDDVRVVEPIPLVLPDDLFFLLNSTEPTTPPLHVQSGSRITRLELGMEGYRTAAHSLGKAGEIADAMLGTPSVPEDARILDQHLVIHELRAFRVVAPTGDAVFVHEPGPRLFPDDDWPEGIRDWLLRRLR